ncbi:serine/threonine protein kinase [bacterium]|nr:serine/threonine protein kinase [bacterium]MBP9810123.1 serine/threonine protein kinase [bacterium]
MSKSGPSLTAPEASALAQPAADRDVCRRCGKARAIKSREGSFTAYLFQELRCHCGDSSSSQRRSAADRGADRVAQRKQFTQAVRGLANSAGAPCQAQFANNTIVGGTFKIVSLIGEGGMSAVYLAEHLGLHRNFALKILSPELVNENGWLRFQSEAQTLAALNHRTFVKVYDLGIHEGTTPFYSMDYLRGYSLEELIAGDGPMPLAQMLSTFIEILDGLAYAHRNGIVHRDLKPANIMICTVDGSRAVKLLDFGISKLIGSATTTTKMQQLTSAGDVFGSPFYMSPEQSGGEAVDARSDIYSLGCSMFEVLSGFVPYDGENALDTILMHQEAEIPSILDFEAGSDLPPSIDIVLAKCLAKRPDDRYQSAKELALDLTRISEGKDVQDYGLVSTVGETNAMKRRGRIKSDDGGQFRAGSRKLTSVPLAIFMLTVAALALGSYVVFQGSLRPKSADERQPSRNSVSNLELLDSAPGVWTHFDYAQEPKGSEKDQTPFSSLETVGNKTKLVFNFPEDIALGLLSDDFVNGLVGVGRNAKGRLEYPSNVELTYTPTTILKKYPQYLKRFKPGDFHILNLDQSAAGDEMLKAVAANAPWIEYLVFKEAKDITAKSIPSLSSFYNLRILEASGSTISGDILAQADCWAKLEQLHWEQANNPGPLLKKLQSSPITVLRLEHTNLTSEDFESIAKLSGLTNLTLTGSRITEKDCKVLAKLKHVRPFKPQEASY